MIFLFFLIFQVSASASSLNNLYFSYKTTKEVTLSSGKKIKITYKGFEDKDAVKVFETVKIASEKAQKYLSIKGFNNSDCKILEIEFYDLKTPVINNRKLMTSVNWSELGKNKMIYAYFDSSTKANQNKSMIFMTASTEYDPRGLDETGRVKIISHEIMHYWQDRTCNRYHDVERQAQDFADTLI